MKRENFNKRRRNCKIYTRKIGKRHIGKNRNIQIFKMGMSHIRKIGIVSHREKR